MPGNFKNEDMRIQKTYGALMDATIKLLENRSFNQITVNDLCEEAQISRTTFYSHFFDKYDLLIYWLNNTKSKIEHVSDGYNDIEKSINGFVYDNKKIIKHLIEDANAETYELLCEFVFSLLTANIDKTDGEQMSPQYIVLSKFCSGGIMNYLQWQTKNRFPEDLEVMNPYFFAILKKCLEWNAEQE